MHKDRTALYANVGASTKFGLDFLKPLEDNNFLKPKESTQVFYIEGYFVPQRFEVCRYIVDHYIKGRHLLALNLSATYIVDKHFDEISYLAEKSFFIFGNISEYNTLRIKKGYLTNDEMAYDLSCSYYPKIIVITDGSNYNTLVTTYNGDELKPGPSTYKRFTVPKVENIVDTTGAGDSFVAGFLHAFLEKQPLDECIRFAADVAAKVITQVGCYMPLKTQQIQ